MSHADLDGYLAALRRSLWGLPRAARRGIVDEHRAHVLDAASESGGQDPGNLARVLGGLEPPRTVARRYREIYSLSRPYSVGFGLVAVLLSIATIPVWEVASPGYSSGLVFLLLLGLLYIIGSVAGKRVGALAGLAAAVTRLVVFGLLLNAVGDIAFVQPGAALLYLIASLLLVPLGYMPGRVKEKWVQRTAEGI